VAMVGISCFGHRRCFDHRVSRRPTGDDRAGNDAGTWPWGSMTPWFEPCEPGGGLQRNFLPKAHKSLSLVRSALPCGRTFVQLKPKVASPRRSSSGARHSLLLGLRRQTLRQHRQGSSPAPFQSALPRANVRRHRITDKGFSLSTPPEMRAERQGRPLPSLPLSSALVAHRDIVRDGDCWSIAPSQCAMPWNSSGSISRQRWAPRRMQWRVLRWLRRR